VIVRLPIPPVPGAITGWFSQLPDCGAFPVTVSPIVKLKGRTIGLATAAALIAVTGYAAGHYGTGPLVWASLPGDRLFAPNGQQAGNDQPAVPLEQPRQGPSVPRRGAYLGAWVKPEGIETDDTRVAAVTSFERQVGRELDIVHTYHTWTDEFPSDSDIYFARRGSVLLLSWAGADTRMITSGSHDSLIRERARAIKALGVPVFLQWRWEMDRPNLQASVWSPADFIAAWKHMRGIFAEAGADNVAWVWCPTAFGFSKDRAQPFYPGDAHVEWLCANAAVGSGHRPLKKVLSPFLKWARGHPKPIMIGEFSAPEGAPGERAAWLHEAGVMAKEKAQVKALVYFDSDSEQDEPDWSFSLRGSPSSLTAFGRLLKDPFFDSRGLRGG